MLQAEKQPDRKSTRNCMIPLHCSSMYLYIIAYNARLMYSLASKKSFVDLVHVQLVHIYIYDRLMIFARSDACIIPHKDN